MANVSENLLFILFADDTTVLIEGTNIITMITSLDSELAKLTEWLNPNKLSINVSKSHYIWYSIGQDGKLTSTATYLQHR